ncbi:MAG: hypothetical protein M0O99_05635 [Desulfuromonas thiophila]|nr:hypothetical protein [Desulfuromonas thiophila]
MTWGDSSSGGDSSAVEGQLAGVEQIYSNVNAFAALKSDGTVVTWGASDFGGNSSAVEGQLAGVEQIYSNGYAFAAVKSDGTVVTWGASSFGGDSSAVADQLTGMTKFVGWRDKPVNADEIIGRARYEMKMRGKTGIVVGLETI